MEGLMYYASPLGRIILAGQDDKLAGLWFEGQRHCTLAAAPEMKEHSLPVLKDACRWLELYFSGRDPGFMLPLAPAGTPFRIAVWQELLGIPYGTTISYGELAKRLHCSSARAVGSAVGHNPISLIIPCHRVIGGNGRLTGYAGGLERKRALLTLEGVSVNGDHITGRM